RMRSRVRRVKLVLWDDDVTGEKPDWGVAYEEVASAKADRVTPSWGRSADDIYMLYTGGTTGMPKGVMWRMGDLIDAYAVQTGGAWQLPAAPGGVGLPACPLMHGTGSFVAFIVMNGAGSMVTLQKRTFDPIELLDT